MIQMIGRFCLGSGVGALLSLVGFWVARSFFLSSIQTPESDPHYVILYAGLSGELTLAVILLIPMICGLIASWRLTLRLQAWALMMAVAFALLTAAGLAYASNTILFDAFWLGMD